MEYSYRFVGQFISRLQILYTFDFNKEGIVSISSDKTTENGKNGNWSKSIRYGFFRH